MMDKFRLQISMIVGLLLLQSKQWESRIRYELRFILCGFFTYISIMILKPLGEIIIGKEDALLLHLFDGPAFFIIVLLTILWGYIGLWSSIISGSLYSSLLRKI